MVLKNKPSANERQVQKTDKVRTEERFAHMLNNPKSNLSKPKRAKLLLLFKEFKAKQKEATKGTLARINQNLERIVGRERIKMMKSMLLKSAPALNRGDLTELPRLFTLLKSDRVPLRVGRLSIYRLGNKLYMKNAQGSFTFEFRAGAKGKWEILQKGKKLPKHPISTKKNPLSGLFDKVGGFEGFYCRGQNVLTAQVPKEAVKPKEGKEAVVATKLMKDLNKFMLNTKTSDGPLPASLVSRIRKLSKTPSVIEGSVAEGKNVLDYGVYVRSAVINGRKIYQLSIQEKDPKVGVRGEVVRYWPIESDAIAARFGKTKAQARFATKYQPKPKIGPAKAKKADRAYAKFDKAYRERIPATTKATAKLLRRVVEGPKQRLAAEKKYIAVLLSEAKGLAREVSSYQKLSKFSKRLIEEARQARLMDNAEKGKNKPWTLKDTSNITNKVVQYRQIVSAAVRKLESGKGTVASLRKTLINVYAKLPNTPTKTRLARRMKGLPKAPTKTA